MTQTRTTVSGTQASVALGGREFQFSGSEDFAPTGEFALWIALPVAMRSGGVLQLDTGISSIARRNAEKLSLIWSSWLPKLFRPVTVEARGLNTQAPPAETRPLMLFSGGVDSTYSLRRTHHETGERPDLLTVQGMDYRRQDLDRFAALQKKTEGFREAHSGKNVVVSSNAASIYRRFGITAGISHGFQLFGTLFLFDKAYRTGAISSDYSAAQDLMTRPWGTNSLTNELFSGEIMKIATLHNDVTRGEKIAALADDHLALSSLSFCKNYAARPENCGVCSKCVRTKAMFVATGHDVPPIFHVGGYNQDLLRFLNIERQSELTFALDILDQAEKHNTMDQFEGLRAALFEPRHPNAFTRAKRKISSVVIARRARKV